MAIVTVCSIEPWGFVPVVICKDCYLRQEEMGCKGWGDHVKLPYSPATLVVQTDWKLSKHIEFI